MADVNRGNRPLSPHLQVYRPQMTSMSSILVRITGIGVLVLSVLVVAWLVAASASPEAFAAMDGFLRSWFGLLIVAGGTWALFYHMFGRLRHVVWDFGYWLDVPTSKKMALGMFGFSTVLMIIAVFAL
ncbi:MAG: succinate dehydrogenase, cytochrome b556 subunit [Pseudomonadota bacterium]